MKKTSLIVLTIVASLSISVGSAQSNPPTNTYSPDYLYESENNRDTIHYDTLNRARRSNIQVDPSFYTYYNFYYNIPIQPYNYYYRSRFWNGMFRFWAPNRYHRLITRPGFVPHRLRAEHNASLGSRTAYGRVTQKRGGFGSSGRMRSQVN